MSRRREASIVTGYAADILMHGDAPMPPKLSRAVKDWAQGLRPDELKLLLRAGQDAVFQHISGQGLVTGVPKLSPLPPRKAPAPAAIPRRYEDLHELVPMPAISILGCPRNTTKTCCRPLSQATSTLSSSAISRRCGSTGTPTTAWTT